MNNMGKIEWEEFKGKFPRRGIYFVKFLHDEQEDYTTVHVWNTEQLSMYSIGMSESTARGRVCVEPEDVTFTGYVFLMGLEY